MKALKWLIKEIYEVIPAIIYFAIAFNLIHFTMGLALGPNDVRYYNYLTVTLGALVIGKMLIIVNSFPFINAFPRKPMIYNIVWKFFIYGICVFIFRFLEIMIDTIYHDRSLYDLFILVNRQLAYPLFWATQMWVLLLFLIYITFAEFIQVLGEDTVKKMMFG